MTMRDRTIQQYQQIYDNVCDFAAHVVDNELLNVVLNDYIARSAWSRRQVQRALSHFDTNWRKILQQERERHARQSS